jgi:hypothetical protein
MTPQVFFCALKLERYVEDLEFARWALTSARELTGICCCTFHACHVPVSTVRAAIAAAEA